MVAPNPSSQSTTISYSFANSNNSNTIVVTDLVGRQLQFWQVTDAKGIITFDCSALAQGHYMIVMKQNDKPLASTKLMKN